MKQLLLFSLLLVLPLSCFGLTIKDSDFSLYAHIISYANFALVITSALCIKYYFFLGDRNQTPFQIFNLIFGIVFYIAAITFLVNEKSFYVGYEQLNNTDCIKRFFIGEGVNSMLQWLVIVGLIINILYIRKYHDA